MSRNDIPEPKFDGSTLVVADNESDARDSINDEVINIRQVQWDVTGDSL